MGNESCLQLTPPHINKKEKGKTTEGKKNERGKAKRHSPCFLGGRGDWCRK